MNYEVRERLEDYSDTEGPGHILLTGYLVYDPLIQEIICECSHKYHAEHIVNCCDFWVNNFNRNFIDNPDAIIGSKGE